MLKILLKPIYIINITATESRVRVRSQRKIKIRKLKMELVKCYEILKYFFFQAVMVNKTLYISGQLGLGKDGQIVGGGTLAQVWSH